MIALILGGSAAVWSELEEARALVGARHHIVVAANLAGVGFEGRLDGWASLHPEHLPDWMAKRAASGLNADARTFTPDTTPERWPGSSGLFALQVALTEMGASGAILCGVPMDNQAGSLSHDRPWNGGSDYRRAFELALPDIGARTRSMGGWTRDLFGAPTRQWADAINPARPLGVTASDEARSLMHKVTNTSDAHQTFWTMGLDGQRQLVHLDPGETSEPVQIDPNQRVFQTGALKVGSCKPTAAKPAAKRAPAKKTAKAKAAAKTPAQPITAAPETDAHEA